MKYKELRREVEELNYMLNMANGTVAKQIQEIKRLNDIIDESNDNVVRCIKAYENIEGQLEIQDNELARRLTIINYLEDKLYGGRYD